MKATTAILSVIAAALVALVVIGTLILGRMGDQAEAQSRDDLLTAVEDAMHLHCLELNKGLNSPGVEPTSLALGDALAAALIAEIPDAEIEAAESRGAARAGR